MHALTVDLLGSINPARLDEIIDRRWDPPVTVAVRIVSVAEDCLQHLGQANYVAGLLAARRRRTGPDTPRLIRAREDAGYCWMDLISRNSSKPWRPYSRPYAGLLVAAERGVRVERAAVDLDLAGAQPAGDRAGVVRVARPHAAGEAVDDAVGDGTASSSSS